MSSQSLSVTYTLQIISANDLPVRRLKLLGERNVFVKATVEDRSVQTKMCKCTSSPEWNETFQIDACKRSSVMLLQLSCSTRGTSLNCASEISISDLLQRCLNKEDAELDLRGMKSGLQGRIKIRLSLLNNKSLIGCVDDLLSVTTPPAMVAQSIASVLDRLDFFMQIAGEAAKVHPYAKLAWDVLSVAHKVIVAQVEIDKNVADLANTMEDVYSFVSVIEEVPSKIQLLEDIIQRIFTQTAECAIFIQEYNGHGFAGRLLRENMGASTPANVTRLAQSLITLRSHFDTCMLVQIATVSFRTQTVVDIIQVNQALSMLGSSGVGLAKAKVKGCLPGTRRDVIDEIHEWALQPSKGDSSNVLWVYGVAGIGKSAVAATVATHFFKMGRLGAFVSFDRGSPKQSQPDTVVEALARQIANFDGRFTELIVKVINDRTTDAVLEAPLSKQFDRLIVKTLASIPDIRGEGPIVIVLDSLDACGQPDDRKDLLEVLVDQMKSLPPNFRFIITSRPVNDIREAFTRPGLHPHMKSRELRSSSHSDIYAYFRFRMEITRCKNEDLREEWPGPTAIAELTARAFGFFAWAVNISDFVEKYRPAERLSLVLHPSISTIYEPNPPLDELYRAALNSAGDWEGPDFVSDFRAIMGTIIKSAIEISPTAIDRPFPRPTAGPILRGLGSVLTHVPVVRVLHPSFLDFLSSYQRCGCENWYFEPGLTRGSADPATLCLQRMNVGLNYYGDAGNMTLPSRIATKVLSEELAYACQSWAYHIHPNETLEPLAMEMLVAFLRTHLLRWVEAMSSLKKSEEIVPMLQRIAAWFEEQTFEEKSLKNLVIEAMKISRHVYLQRMNAGLKRNICNMTLSATLSAHPTAEVLPEELAYACQSWVDHVCPNGTFEPSVMEMLGVFLRTHLLHWFEAMSLLKKSKEIVPMLQQLAKSLEESTFEDNTLEDKCIKNLVIEAINFACKFAADIAEHPLYVYYTALPLLPSHSMLYQLFHDSLADPSVLIMPSAHWIRCMAFSTNGRQLVTGSFNRATVWDTATGEVLLKMAGMDVIEFYISAVFSYDGSRIACGTDKSNVYVWDSVSGAKVIGPLRHSGHRQDVNAVALSTAGERLLSGCTDGEVILWNIMFPKGNRTIRIKHHPGCGIGKRLVSVAISPDGSQIASCSQQGDVYVWDSQTGGIMWSAQEPLGSGLWSSVSFLSSNTGAFLLAQTKERTQARDTCTGDLCSLPDSLAGVVGLTRGDFMVNRLIKRIEKHYPTRHSRSFPSPQWAAQGEYFAFSAAYADQCHVVHIPKAVTVLLPE
ncbi:hypothetical protein FIBSPDRAFT_1051773 [Athelia psychrophila]|uniref:C2 domain-containing protein n=1 Tax=Athelia psychrophila TaxID=1759441 RepID=A0A165YHC0_9AGAM|nr:hypothetical protein FIBSPDRAFT_1051773 [Fibularhizoctonia sp. CBS 109695]